MGFLGDRVEAILIELADCLCREIAARDLPEPCFCGVLPGEEAALVYCNACDGGQAWVRLVSIGQPQQEVALNHCAGLMAVEIEMGMIFGFLPMDEDGEPVDMPANLAAVERQVTDMDVMHHVLTCCTLSIREKVSNLSYSPIGPNSTCVGGVWTGTVPVI